MTATIAIPFAGSATGIEEAVRSVFSQTVDDWILVLVSDGADERVTKRLRTIDDERVTVYEDGSRVGLAARLNQVSAGCRTRLLFRMDCDDIMHPDRIRVQTNFLDSQLVDIVGTRAWVIDEESRVQGKYREPGAPTSPRDFLRSNVLSHPTVAGTADWFKKNPYDETMLRCQDMELWARTHGTVNLSKLDEPLLFYRISRDIKPRKQATSSQYNRRVVRKYGPSILGSRATNLQLGKSYLKQATFGAASKLGLSGQLYARKFDTPTGNELAETQRMCDLARSAPVPGWPDGN